MTARLVSIERRTADGRVHRVPLLAERHAVAYRNDVKAAHVAADHQDALRRIDAIPVAVPTVMLKEADQVGVVRGLVAIALALLVMALAIITEEQWK